VSEPFIGEIKIVSFGFAPKGWAACEGQTMQIPQNLALFSLLGTTFGGDGRTTFNLPDMRGRVAVDVGPGFSWGQPGGEAAHTLTLNELPTHTHAVMASSTAGDTEVPTSTVLARSDSFVYSQPSSLVALNPGTIPNMGGSQAHQNMEPSLTLYFCIALVGIFPPRP
jgi:microcystin-dependent protein